MAEHGVFICIALVAFVGCMFALRFVALADGDESITFGVSITLAVCLWIACVLIVILYMLALHGTALGEIIGARFFAESASLFPGEIR